MVLTSHFVSFLAGVKHLAEVTNGIVDKRVTSVFYARRITALDACNNETVEFSRSSRRIWFRSRRFASRSRLLTFAHRWKLVVEAGIEASASRWSYKKATGVTGVVYRCTDVVRAARIPIRRCGHRHRRIRWLLWPTTCSWFYRITKDSLFLLLLLTAS